MIHTFIICLTIAVSTPDGFRSDVECYFNPPEYAQSYHPGPPERAKVPWKRRTKNVHR